jgi:hypothetical protein
MGEPLIHYEAKEFHGDRDVVLVDGTGKRIRTDAVIYASELAEDVVAFLNWRRVHPEVDLAQALSC